MIECRFFCYFAEIGQRTFFPGVPRTDEVVVLDGSAYTVRSVAWIINGGVPVAHIDLEAALYGPRMPHS